MTTASNRHPVVFVGAGPGDPELITVKGRRALEQADLIIYAGSLVPEAVLAWARPETRRVNSAGLHMESIIAEIKGAYHAGGRVIRLHTGDPSLYGAVFEQMAELNRLDIPFKVIPGVTAAFAAAAAMGIEYTLPQVSQTLILTRMAGRTPVPEAEKLAALAAHRSSIAIYLSISLIDEVQTVLCTHYGEKAPCAVVYRVSQPEEKIITTTDGELAQTVRREKITRQALIIAGQVLAVSLETLPHRSRLYDKEFSHAFRSCKA